MAHGYGRWPRPFAIAISHQPSAIIKVALMAALFAALWVVTPAAHDIPQM
jgi:hypothetical protein